MKLTPDYDIWHWLSRPVEEVAEKVRSLKPESKTHAERGVAFMARWIMPELGEKFDVQPRKINFIKPSVAPKEAPPTLKRPILFLHGYNAAVTEFCEMTNWLSQAEGNINGGRLESGNLDGIDRDAKLFRLEFSSPYQNVSDNVRELGAAVEAICFATHTAQIDVVGHSKGGLDVRAYLNEDNSRLRKVVTIATPHLGTELADISCRMREVLDLTELEEGNKLLNVEVLREFFVDRLDEEGGLHNEFLHHLNSTWKKQCRYAEFLALGGIGVPTFVPEGLTLKGDGIVAIDSALALEGAHKGTLEGIIHSHLPAAPATMMQVAKFIAEQ